MRSYLYILIFTLLSTHQAFAGYEHDRIKRFVFFPFKVEQTDQKAAEDAWWDLRERLTESRRFLVASKNFMVAKDVFQPRGELKPADAIILGRILDASALITFFVKERTLSMRVYESVNGLTLYSSDVELHPAVPVGKQIGEVSKKLLYDFISAIPYQGHVYTDNLIGRPAFYEGEKLLFKAEVGIGSQVSVGDNVELVRISADQLKPLFPDGHKAEVYAEGVVVAVDRHVVTVQVTRKADGIDIKQDALMRVPREQKRIQEMYGAKEDLEKNIQVSLIRDEEPITDQQKERKPLVTSLAWLGNLTLILLLAF